jgi:hypothetical protein
MIEVRVKDALDVVAVSKLAYLPTPPDSAGHVPFIGNIHSVESGTCRAGVAGLRVRLERRTANVRLEQLRLMFEEAPGVVSASTLLDGCTGLRHTGGVLRVDSQPQGATVFIDGIAIFPGYVSARTPLLYRGLEVGASHEVTVILDRHEPFRTRVRVASDSDEVKLAPVFVSSATRLAIDIVGPHANEAHAFVDKKEVGVGRFHKLTVAPGWVEVAVTHAARVCEPDPERLRVEEGEEGRVYVSCVKRKEGTTPPGMGELQVLYPRGAELFVNDQVAATGDVDDQNPFPRALLDGLSFGRKYKLVVRGDGLLPFEETITMSSEADGATMRVELKREDAPGELLKPLATGAVGSLWLIRCGALRAPAEIFEGDRYLGKTMSILKLPVGPHTLRLVASHHERAVRIYIFHGDQTIHDCSL